MVWYDDCMLRYSDQFFFSLVSPEPNYVLDSRVNIGFDTAWFNQVLMATLTATAANASSLVVGEMFATQRFTRWHSAIRICQIRIAKIA